MLLSCSEEPAWALQVCDKGVLSQLAKADGNPTGGIRGQEGEKELESNHQALDNQVHNTISHPSKV